MLHKVVGTHIACACRPIALRNPNALADTVM